MTAVTGGRRVRAWVLNLGDSGAKKPPHPQALGRKFKRLNGGAGVGRRRVRADRQRPARSARLETDALSARAPHRCPVCKPRTGGWRNGGTSPHWTQRHGLSNDSLPATGATTNGRRSVGEGGEVSPRETPSVGHRSGHVVSRGDVSQTLRPRRDESRRTDN